MIDKKHKTIESYYVVVKMDDGSRDRNIGLSPQLWETFEVGDRIHKDAGKLLPTKG